MGDIAPLLKWLGLRGIFISSMRLRLIHIYRMPKILFNSNNKDQLKLMLFMRCRVYFHLAVSKTFCLFTVSLNKIPELYARTQGNALLR